MELYTPPDRARAWRRLTAWLIAIAALPALHHLHVVGNLLLRRLQYRYDAHWMDSGTLLHAHRLLRGLPIYPELDVSAGFLPNVYPPVLYFALAGLGAVFGLDYATGRALSVAATTLAAVLLAREVYRCFRGLPLPLVPAILTLGAIAAGFPATGGWYDAIMTDPLALALSVVSGTLLLGDPGAVRTPRLAIAALVMVLTVYTKQSYLLLASWQIAFFSLRRPRAGLLLAVAALALGAVCFAVAQHQTQGNFVRYVVTQPFRHPLDQSRIATGLSMLLRFAPYLPLVFVTAAVVAYKRALSRATAFWLGMLALSLPLALVHYAKAGGWHNNFMPVVVFGPAAALCVLGDLCRVLRPPAARTALALLALSAAVYLLARRYPTDAFAAKKYRRVAAEKLNEYVAGMNGDVLIPGRPFLAIRNGSHVEQVQLMSWYDALMAGQQLAFDDFLRRTRPRFVILSDQEPAVMVEAMARDYYTRGRIPSELWLAQTLEDTLGYAHDASSPVFPGQLQWVLERSRPEPPGSRCLFEFEGPGYPGFEVQGEAFSWGPVRVDSQRGKLFFASAGVVVGIVGEAYATSYSPQTQDLAVGRLTSPPFAISEKYLRLRIGGGSTPATRVELQIEGEKVLELSGTGATLLTQTDLDLADKRGKTARLVLIDEDPYGRLLVDHVCLIDDPGG